MSDSVILSNVYAAYTASNRSEKNVSDLSQLAKNEKVDAKVIDTHDKDIHMDKVVISAEALERLRSMSLAN